VIWRLAGYVNRDEWELTSMAKAVAFGTVLAAAACVMSLTAAADCTCRALGQDVELGGSACLATPYGPRYAVCGMVLNNTSWQFSEMPCVPGQPAQISTRHEGNVLRAYARANRAAAP
jgi:hypothetical protein